MRVPAGSGGALSSSTASLAMRSALRLEVHAADELVAGRRPQAAVVGEAAALVLVALDRVGLEARADVGDDLLGVAAVAGGERLPLALGRVQALGERDALHLVHRPVGGQQVGDLAIERDLERVLLDRRLEPAVGRRAPVEDHGVAQGRRAGLRDPHGLGRDAVRLAGGQVVAGGEAPGAVDEHPDAEALGLARLHALDAGRLDVDRFLDPPDHAHVRVRRAQGGGRVEGTVGQIAHWRRVATSARWRRRAKAVIVADGAVIASRRAGAVCASRQRDRRCRSIA